MLKIGVFETLKSRVVKHKKIWYSTNQSVANGATFG